MNLLAVFCGGLIGAGLRLGIDALLPHTAPGSFPWSTLLINVAGSFALGLLVARVWPAAPGWLRYGLGTGVLGAFTTFSAVVVSVIQLFGEHPAIAVLYLFASLLLGFGAAGAGLRLGNRPTTRITADE